VPQKGVGAGVDSKYQLNELLFKPSREMKKIYIID